MEHIYIIKLLPWQPKQRTIWTMGIGPNMDIIYGHYKSKRVAMVTNFVYVLYFIM